MQTMDGYLLHSQGGLRAWTPGEVKAMVSDKVALTAVCVQYVVHGEADVFSSLGQWGAEPPRGGGRAGVLKNRKQKTEGGQGPHYD